METMTEADIEKAKSYATLGPAYFAANRMAEALMQNAGASPFQAVAKRCVDEISTAVYQYVEDHLRSDMESNLGHYIRDTVERTVQALLTGERWAMNQYALSQNFDAVEVRKAVAKHGAEPLLLARIADIEAENARLAESLKWAREWGR